jgi:hypothetical protein
MMKYITKKNIKRIVLGLILGLNTLMGYSQSQSEFVYNARFNGQRDPSFFSDFILKNISIPKEVDDGRLYGNVLLKLMIDSTGKLSILETLNSCPEVLETEAKRVVNESAKYWTAGVNAEGKKYNYVFNYNITFGTRKAHNLWLNNYHIRQHQFINSLNYDVLSGYQYVQTDRSTQRPNFNSEEDIDGLRNYISKEMRYPLDALIIGKSGKVEVDFTIDQNGEVVNPRINNTSCELFNEEALRLITSTSGKWTAGKKDGKLDTFRYIIPINFISIPFFSDFLDVNNLFYRVPLYDEYGKVKGHEPIQHYFVNASKHLDKGELDKANVYLSTMLRIYPENDDALLIKAKILLKQNKQDEAKKLLLKAYELGNQEAINVYNKLYSNDSNLKQIIPPQFSKQNESLERHLFTYTEIPLLLFTEPLDQHVIIDFNIKENGIIDSYQVVSSTNSLLEPYALKAIKSTSTFWTPAKLNGVNVPFKYRIKISYPISRIANRMYDNQVKASRAFKVAQEAVEFKNYDVALKNYAESISLVPNYTNPYIQYAKVCFLLNKREDGCKRLQDSWEYIQNSTIRSLETQYCYADASERTKAYNAFHVNRFQKLINGLIAIELYNHKKDCFTDTFKINFEFSLNGLISRYSIQGVSDTALQRVIKHRLSSHNLEISRISQFGFAQRIEVPITILSLNSDCNNEINQREYLQSASTMYQLEYYDLALKLYEVLISKQAQNPTILSKAALTAIKLQDNTKACFYFKKLADLGHDVSAQQEQYCK